MDTQYGNLTNRKAWQSIKIAGSALVISSLIEIGSLYAMFSTMAHAGPEGRFANIGWIATALNLPGIFFLGILQLDSETATMKLAAIIYAVQMPFLWGLTFIIAKLVSKKLKRSKAT